MAAGNEFCSLWVPLQQIDGLCDRTGTDVVEGGGDHWFAPLCARCTAAQMRGGVSGMSRWVIPNGESASSTAWTMHGGAPIERLSPIPLTPMGLVGEGVSWKKEVMFGTC